MSISQPSTDITQRIQRLLEERQQLAKAIASIDETLARVGAALGSNARPQKPQAPVKKPVLAAKPAAKPASVTIRRAPGKFAVSGEQSIIAFVKSKSNPKGNEIEANWKSEGRKGRAINSVSKLVRDKKLKRTPLKGERGSRYSLA